MFSKEYLKHYKKTVHIAFPVVISQLGHIAVAVVDSIMAGKLGGISLAAATLCFSILVPFLMVGIGISYGLTPLVSKYAGENRSEEVGSLLKHGLLINIVAGFVLAAFLYWIADFIPFLKQPDIVTTLSIPFFKILALSLIPLMVYQGFKQFAEGLAYTKQAMFISISSNVINIVLIYLLVTGKFGLPALGLNGIAVATLVARIYMAIAIFVYVFYHKSFKEYWHFKRTQPYNGTVVKDILRISLPVGVQLGLETGAFGFAAIMVGWIGSNELAAHQVALNLAAVTYMAASGIAAAATVRVGFELGKRDYESLKKAAFSAFFIVTIFMSTAAVFFLIFRQYLPLIYIEDQEIQSLASSLLLIAAFFQLSDGLQVVALGVLRGFGDVKVPTTVAIVAYWIIALPLGYILGFHLKLGVQGIWLGLLAGLSIAAILLILRFLDRRRKLFKVDFRL